MKILHPTQKRLIELLKSHIDDPLTIRDLQEELGVSSPSIIQHHIRQLEKKGYLKRNPNNPKDYQVLADSPERKIAYINLYGLAFCGPSGSLLDGDPIDKIPVPTQILTFPSSEAFLVKATGDSMTPKINEGDLVIAKKTSDAESGDIVVCVNNGETLIKKIQIEKNNVLLISTNQQVLPFIASEDFRIEGIVKGLISYNLN